MKKRLQEFALNLRKAVLKIDKRQRFIIATGTIFVANFLLTLLPFSVAVFFLPILLVVVYAATYFAHLEGIEQIEWFVLFIMPLYFTVSMLLFYYLLPSRLLAKVPYMLVSSVITYAILLSENIFNVGVEKSLPLYRAAFSVANFVSLVVLFLIFTVLFSFRLNFLFNTFFGGLLSWPVFFHGIWSSSPRAVLEERVYKFATILSFLLSFVICILNFVPIKTSIYSLYTVANAYVLLGITQEIIQNTVFKERIREYLAVFGVMSLLVILTAIWN